MPQPHRLPQRSASTPGRRSLHPSSQHRAPASGHRQCDRWSVGSRNRGDRLRRIPRRTAQVLPSGGLTAIHLITTGCIRPWVGCRGLVAEPLENTCFPHLRHRPTDTPHVLYSYRLSTMVSVFVPIVPSVHLGPHGIAGAMIRCQRSNLRLPLPT